MKISTFISRYKLTARVEAAPDNPNWCGEWSADARHFRVHITMGGSAAQLVIPFSQGSAHTAPPVLADVLDCLASDAATVENARTFEEWAAELGFDTDSRKAERSYEVCVKQATQLEQFLGHEAYDALLWKTERN